MTHQPSLKVLNCLQDRQSEVSLPLHAQLKRVLRIAINDHFEDGQRFWPENTLINHLGLSPYTVRRALGDLALEGILERQVAKGTFVRKSRIESSYIGALVAQQNSEFFSECMEHLSYSCRERNYRILTYHTHSGESAKEVLSQINAIPALNRFVLLGNPVAVTSDLWKTLNGRGKKVVCVDTPPGDNKANFVGIDNGRGIQLAMQLLQELGHERIIFLANEPGEHPSVIAREQAFLGFAESAGMHHIDVVSCQTRPWEDAGKAVLRVMPQVWKQRPTAIMAASDVGAWNAIAWLNKEGISIPQQVSVVGFDNRGPSQFTHPTLTSVAQPYSQIAHHVLELIDNDTDEPQQILLEPELVQRGSTGPVPR
jgi:DNA-binding LacI/PurR family transcriptional regulator